jgi:hypothetical protein
MKLWENLKIWNLCSISLVEKHFPKDHRLHKIFNKNTIKVSYSCTQNMANIIKSHNNRTLKPRNKNTHENCNCNTKEQCPLQNKCLVTNIVYKAHITTNDDPQGRDYIGLTEGNSKNVLLHTRALSTTSITATKHHCQSMCGV